MNAAPTPVRVDLLALIGRDVPLHKESRGEWAGSCPFCREGRDRFNVWPEGERPNWWCRRCGRKGDAISYVMERDRIGFRQAVALLEGLPPMPTYRPDPPKPLMDEQRAAFLEVAFRCHEQITGQERPLAWLANRGIGARSIETFMLGYNPGRPGDSTAIAGCRVPCGLVIPLIGVDGQIHGISVRRAARPAAWPAGKDWRYQQVAGSRVPLYGLPEERDTVLLVEGLLDAVLAEQLAGYELDVAALGTAKGSIDAAWYGYLLAHRRWLICMDSDDAGRRARDGWLASSERAVAWEVPHGKDLTEWWQAAGTDVLRDALLAASGWEVVS